MYGLLLQSAIEIICAKYGQETWEQIKTTLNLEYNSFSAFQQYGETLFIRIIKILSQMKNEPLDNLIDLFGHEFVSYIATYGYDRILRILGHNMRDFLNGLDNLHEYMRYTYPRMRPPSFYVEKETATGLTLHYRSRRRGFVHYVIGQIKEVGHLYYNTDVDIEIVSEREDFDMSHVVLELKFENKAYIDKIAPGKATTQIDQAIDCHTFFELFPFHIVLSESLEIVSAGGSLTQLFPHIVGELLRDTFTLARPIITLTWKQILSHSNNVFEFTSMEPLHKNASDNDSQSNDPKNQNSSEMLLVLSANRDTHEEYLRLRGQMLYLKEWNSIIYLATPVLENLDAMFNTGLYINDLSMHDSSRDLVLAGTQQSAELKLALDQEKQKSKALEERMKKLDAEMKRTDLLLYQMIPKKVADRLRGGEKAISLCETFESCTILFSDVVGFTSICSTLTPMEVLSILNEMYTKFDKCLETHSCYKVETIGDAYMICSGVPEPTRNHAAEIINMAFDMLDAIITVTNPNNNEKLKIRIGCHSGSVVAGIVGIKMLRYCLFGDTITMANKMEQTSKALHIHVSEPTYKLLDHKAYEIQARQKMTIGNETVSTYFILNKKDRAGKVLPRPFHAVLDEMKRQETEEAKKKQTNMLRGGAAQNIPTTTVKQNGFVPSEDPHANIGPVESSIPTKSTNDSKVLTNATESIFVSNKIDDKQVTNNGDEDGTLDYTKKISNRQERSRTCELL